VIPSGDAANGDGPDDQGELLFYQTEEGESRIQLRSYDGTVWLSQRLIADLYQVSVKTVNEHLQRIYEDEEAVPEATIRKFRIVQTEGERRVSRLVDHYRLEAILAVGYRVRSRRGVQFRRWATTQLRELLVKGFVMDDERLKEGRNLGTDYFDELLERIRDIRASEKRFYQKINNFEILQSTNSCHQIQGFSGTVMPGAGRTLLCMPGLLAGWKLLRICSRILSSRFGRCCSRSMRLCSSSVAIGPVCCRF
jgi:hypothetical protein